jgi:uncharacterized alkaline shock family protein YloU
MVEPGDFSPYWMVPMTKKTVARVLMEFEVEIPMEAREVRERITLACQNVNGLKLSEVSTVNIGTK